ncbi:MAG: hypothetical protein ACXIVL_02310 [Oceanicaulis sp.]
MDFTDGRIEANREPLFREWRIDEQRETFMSRLAPDATDFKERFKSHFKILMATARDIVDKSTGEAGEFDALNSIVVNSMRETFEFRESAYKAWYGRNLKKSIDLIIHLEKHYRFDSVNASGNMQKPITESPYQNWTY